MVWYLYGKPDGHHLLIMMLQLIQLKLNNRFVLVHSYWIQLTFCNKL